MFTRKNLFYLLMRHTLIALACVIACLVMILLLSKEIEKVADSVVRNRNLASTLEQRTALLTQLSRDAQIIGRNDEAIIGAYVPSENITDFISALESIGQKNGITQTFRFGSPSPSSIAAPFPLQFITYQNAVQANLPTFIQYLKDLEKLPFFTKVDSVSITSQTDQGIQGGSNASFSATLFTRGTQ